MQKLAECWRKLTGSRDHARNITRAEASCSLAGALARDDELARAEALIQEGLHELPAGLTI